jgi:predicted RNA binding protein YcfA (HicA-like mRNA interferase family)
MLDLVEGFGFEQSRTDGSHHIFARPDILELVVHLQISWKKLV